MPFLQCLQTPASRSKQIPCNTHGWFFSRLGDWVESWVGIVFESYRSVNENHRLSDILPAALVSDIISFDILLNFHLLLLQNPEALAEKFYESLYSMNKPSACFVLQCPKMTRNENSGGIIDRPTHKGDSKFSEENTAQCAFLINAVCITVQRQGSRCVLAPTLCEK